MTAVKWTAARDWLGTVIRLGLAVVWGWAAYEKLVNPRQFVQAVRAYDATPEWLSKAIGYGLPVLEASIALLLLFGIATRAVAAVSALLFVVFLIGIIQAWARGIKLDCGCFGGGGQTDNPNYTIDILRDVGLLALSVYLVVFAVTQLSVDRALRSNDHVTPPSAKRLRRDPKAKQRYDAMRKARQKELNTQQRYIAGTCALVVVLVSLIGISVQSNRAQIQGSLQATNASVNDGVVVGKSSAPVTLDVYEDFQCPICEQLETSLGDSVTSLVSKGTVKIKYHMMAFLDSSSGGNRYSTRAANAAICASDVSTDAFAAYHKVLFGKDSKGQKVQPEENGNGRTDAELEAYFKQALPKATADQVSTFNSCVTGETHSALVSAITDKASKDNVTGTPTVLVDGKTLKNATKASILDAISKADKS